MHAPITRRDVLHGMGAAALGAVAAPWLTLGCRSAGNVETVVPETRPYPPGKTGMRGDHPGSFDVAHQRAWSGAAWRSPQVLDEAYDLVVVGGGISGLAAAYYYRKAAGKSARILILDNHDDFGGVATRNEFQHAGRSYPMFGGSVYLDYGDYSDVTNGLLQELGVDIPAMVEQQDPRSLQAPQGMASGIYFDADSYGRDAFVEADIMPMSKPGPDGVPKLAQRVDAMPLSEAARGELKRFLTERTDYLPEVPDAEKAETLAHISYRDFLTKRAGMSPEAAALFHRWPHALLGLGTDATPALDALGYGLPGLRGLGGFGAETEQAMAEMAEVMEPGAFFADGNASLPRLLVRSLVPPVAPGRGMNDIVAARFDYTKLDAPDQPVRIRLSSTAVHADSLADASGIDITYVRAGQAYRVRARNCVMACNHEMIPFLCPALPEPQKEALRYGEKTPLLTSNVLLRNGTPIDSLGAGAFYAPGRLHSMGWIQVRCLGREPMERKPEDPQIVQFMGATALPLPGADAREQFRGGLRRLLGMSFEDFERDLRVHLGGMLGDHGFDPARDIQAITVNRWAHGYSYEHNTLFDPNWPEGQAPYEIARQRFGRVAIANADAAWKPYIDAAIDEAHRAVGELVEAGLI